MPVPESCIAEVVNEASAKMHDPQYISNEVDRFIGAQPAVSELLMSQSNDLTVEGVVTALFHAALIAGSVARARRAPVPQLSRDALQTAANTTIDALSKDEPNLASYIASNVEESGTGRLTRSLLALVARALTA